MRSGTRGAGEEGPLAGTGLTRAMDSNMLPLAFLLATWLAPSSSTGFVLPSTAIMRPPVCVSHALGTSTRRFPALSRPQRARCRIVLGGITAASVLPFPDARVLTKVDPDVACVLCDSEAEALLSLKTGQPGQPRQKRNRSMRIGEEEGLPEGRFSVDLGKRSIEGLSVSADGISLPEAPEGASVDLTWDDLKRIAKKGGAWRCHWGTSGYEPSRVDGFSELTGRSASLYPVAGSPPTVVLGGFGMHRFAGDASPAMDTELKLQALGGKLRGAVLDVCTGLGYTTIAAAARKEVEFVATLELDPLMVRMQDANPWSADLRGPKVERYLGDATALLPLIPDASFDAICHDPPAQAMSGELYSAEVYAHFARILKPSGALYHYIGDPDSKASGKLFRGVAERLRGVGLEPSVSRAAYGITAVKST